MIKYKKDTVNIIIPTYNYGRFISDAIKSALKQTYKNTIITIIDNASTDNTRKIVMRYLKKYKNIKYIRNKKNLGYIGNLRKAFEINKCRYICFLAADDILDKNAILLELDAIKKYDAGLVQGDISVFTVRQGHKIIFKEQKTKNEIIYSKTPNEVYHITGLFLDYKKVKKIMKKIQLNEKKYGISAIDRLTMYLVMEYGFVWIPEVISYWREHIYSIGHNFNKENTQIDKCISYYILYRTKIKGDKRNKNIIKAESYMNMSLTSIFNNNFYEGKRCITMSYKLNRFNILNPKFVLILFLNFLPQKISINIIKFARFLYYKLLYKDFVIVPLLLKVKHGEKK